MISSTKEYQAAIIGTRREIQLLAVVDISDPDIVYGNVTMDSVAPWSKSDELHDKIFNAPAMYSTLESNRWLLNGKSKIFPDGYDVVEHIGVCNDVISDTDCYFPVNNPAFVQQEIKNVSILQACSVFFSTNAADGVPADFKVEIYQGGVAYFVKNFVGNTSTEVAIEGFTVYNPDAIKITATKWSLPCRRMRVVEIVPGLYEEWSDRMLASFDCVMQGDFTCLSLPYGTVNLSMDNKSRRFDPRKKNGIFQSIEERQGVKIYIGVRLSDGTIDRKSLGVFYQAMDGWKTSNNSVTMDWSLVDIIGLIANRTYEPPEELPTTLDGWISSVVLQLGDNFKNKYHVDPQYAEFEVVANNVSDVSGKTCGNIVRWACMAAGVWPRADAETGFLVAEPMWYEGNKVTLDNLADYPSMSANKSVAKLIFSLADENNTEYIVPGNLSSSEETVSISNPFIHTSDQALKAARLILSCYGGNVIELTGRGDPSSEIGDVDTVWLDESSATTARRKMQELSISNGVLKDCQSTLLQANGAWLFEESVLITEGGKWKAPSNVKGNILKVAIGQGGQGGSKGQDGYLRDGIDGVESGYGEQGADGNGGKVWFGTININPEQEFDVVIGKGGQPSDVYGQPGSDGEETVFGAYSSVHGKIYSMGYTDIVGGNSFARSGVASPVGGTSDGGKGGSGGDPGIGYREYPEDGVGYYFIEVKKPGPGHPGIPGASGFVLVGWDKEEQCGI